MRFNPPPNWPPPPPGWAPDSNWVPDPSWPPPPPGWPLWVDESMPHYPPYPAQWPPQRPRSRRALWITLAAAVIAALVGVVAVLGLAARTTQAGDQKPSRKPDITVLTRDLLVDKSAFPQFPGGKWSSTVTGAGGKRSPESKLTTSPPECADLYGDPKAATQSAAVTVSNVRSGGPRSMGVHLTITPEQRNVKDYLDKCQSFTQSFEVSGRTVNVDVQLDPLDVDDVPPWAVATVMTSSGPTDVPISLSSAAATISGYYRGVFVVAGTDQIKLRSKETASIDAGTADDLVKLFNAQVEKLEAAP